MKTFRTKISSDSFGLYAKLDGGGDDFANFGDVNDVNAVTEGVDSLSMQDGGIVAVTFYK